MGIGIGQLLIILIIVLILFGVGRLSEVMGELGKGLRAFRNNTKDSKDAPTNKDL